ncbi:hypothetical protein CH253_29655 [Rhodococcus sp. 06-156-3C]|uniref:SGNH/GDSL hydrolase family protein n=1 Tax=Nocardiaceae TaxID=85025 RepID=UPI000522E7FA|nr:MULTISPECIES: SGNH/GDSL hydrolase family protein [Rhodococcus]OZD10795.1 hypothetical protein CH280_21305 [Rhodococcus sp. 06-156-4C]OZD11543.1 hypothetical protein CH253_29655 [Rhodococcus sp. 06-156-3C]OZD13779.1 hypothetical protein CH248_27160 [Rhodococcus sp. 06-156-4a]OZD28075.1 hypothetical protein CH247_20000 [Rhodococcus sp. 06-156-3b]OZD30404.1 hypothetical protein CH284_25740 [Rhodococcus sp. 06-156-3]
MNTQGAKIGIAAAVAAVLLVGLGLWYDNQRGPRTGTDSANEAQPYVPPTPMRSLRLAVIGDQYSVADFDAPRPWIRIVSEARGWFLNSEAGRASGYIAGGSASFTDKVAGVIRNNPDVIVVAGGREDVVAPDRVREQAEALYRDLAQTAPQAKVFVIGPMWDSTPPSPAVLQVNEQVRLAAETAKVPFTDALGWLSDPATDDGQGRLTPEGDQVLADRISAVLSDLPSEVPGV